MIDYVSHTCQDCEHRGKAGNTVRLYEIAQPLMVTDRWLCFPCADKRFKKYMKRKYWTMVDKAHLEHSSG